MCKIKANKATHTPEIHTSANDRAGWLLGRLVQVGAPKKVHVHLSVPAS